MREIEGPGMFELVPRTNRFFWSAFLLAGGPECGLSCPDSDSRRTGSMRRKGTDAQCRIRTHLASSPPARRTG